MREASAAVDAVSDGPPRVEAVFDTRRLPPLAAALDGASADALRAAVAAQGGGALAEGVDAMLHGLRAFDLADADVND